MTSVQKEFVSKHEKNPRVSAKSIQSVFHLTKKINQKFEPYKIIDNEEWFYLSLYGEQNIIIQEIKKYQNKATSNAK